MKFEDVDSFGLSLASGSVQRERLLWGRRIYGLQCVENLVMGMPVLNVSSSSRYPEV